MNHLSLIVNRALLIPRQRGQSVDKFDFCVIPAKAGIQRGGLRVARLDSGFRRNDGIWANLSTDCLQSPGQHRPPLIMVNSG